MTTHEVNFDSLVGPTHNYGGLSYGNVASMEHGQEASNPKKAALQGLEKMKFFSELGLKQAVLPPHERPATEALRSLGFVGNDVDILEKAYKDAPEIFVSCWSASSMWAANAATVCPSTDSADGKVHITPANIASKFHRAIEASFTAEIFRKLFADPEHFVHHNPLPNGHNFGDEGAANHTRFCREIAGSGVHFFVYGRSAFADNVLPQRFPARQALEASQAVARSHGLDETQCIFAKQNPAAIDAGVFHNDVISVGNQNVLFYHEEAFEDSDAVLGELANKIMKVCNTNINLIKVSSKAVSLKDAVASYLFNSQLVTMPSGNMMLLAPSECQDSPQIQTFLEALLKQKSPIAEVQYMNLRQSMKHGAGPACLRLRIVLTEDEIAHTHPGTFLTDDLYTALKSWIEKHYRDRLTLSDLQDHNFVTECHNTLDALTNILNLGPLYPFQKS